MTAKVSIKVLNGVRLKHLEGGAPRVVQFSKR